MIQCLILCIPPVVNGYVSRPSTTGRDVFSLAKHIVRSPESPDRDAFRQDAFRRMPYGRRRAG
ncbi:MAG: hypothetical protein ABIL62_02490 [Planctomycetota bacterium]